MKYRQDRTEHKTSMSTFVSNEVLHDLQCMYHTSAAMAHPVLL